MENNPKLSYQYLNKWDGGGQGSWQNSWGARNQISFNIKVRTDWSSKVLIVTTTKSKPNLSALTQVCNNNIKRKCFPFVSQVVTQRTEDLRRVSSHQCWGWSPGPPLIRAWVSRHRDYTQWSPDIRYGLEHWSWGGQHVTWPGHSQYCPSREKADQDWYKWPPGWTMLCFISSLSLIPQVK